MGLERDLYFKYSTALRALQDVGCLIYVVCQVLCLGEAILFCENCEAAITKNNLEKFLKSLENQLESYTQVLDNMDI